jgi:hypothetical protein
MSLQIAKSLFFPSFAWQVLKGTVSQDCGQDENMEQ